MKPFAVFYATREGHTRRIAEHIANTLRARDHEVSVVDVRSVREPVDLSRYCAAFLAASVHYGRHEPEMAEFVKRHRDALESEPSAFLSVSSSACTAEDAKQSAAARAKAAADAQTVIDGFLTDTGWRPKRVKAVAGAVSYTKYNVLLRLLVRFMVKKAGGPTDTSRDHDLTDYAALDRFVAEMIADAAASSLPPPTARADAAW